MSTISSQLLVTSSALTEDFYKAFVKRSASDKELVFVGRLAVLVVSVIAFVLALNPSETILNLVGYAWAGFGAAFGPVVLLSLYWKRMTKWAAFAGIVVGAVTVIVWELIPAFADVYEIIPGFIACTITILVVSLMTKEPSEVIQREFEESKRLVNE
jgi:sodium/proline symporter